MAVYFCCTVLRAVSYTHLHAGERILNEIYEGGFKHNEQSVRIVEKLEKDGAGLTLTWEVRDGMLNHQTSLMPHTLSLIHISYLKETAQIMDPFCGVGTLLIERAHVVPAREIYATDTYGDAITMGREKDVYKRQWLQWERLLRRYLTAI